MRICYSPNEKTMVNSKRIRRKRSKAIIFLSNSWMNWNFCEWAFTSTFLWFYDFPIKSFERKHNSCIYLFSKQISYYVMWHCTIVWLTFFILSRLLPIFISLFWYDSADGTFVISTDEISALNESVINISIKEKKKICWWNVSIWLRWNSGSTKRTIGE